MNARALGATFVLSVLTLLSLGLGLLTGSFETQWADLGAVLTAYDPQQPLHFAIVELRLPRCLLAFVTGAALAFSGYLMQVLINNPLADPYLLGTASGAALGANLAYLGWLPTLGLLGPSVLAFAGAALVTLAAVGLAWRGGRIAPAQLLLAGLALSSLAGAAISLLTFLSDEESKLRHIVFWLLGSFERARWAQLWLPWAVLLLAVGVFLRLRTALHVLLLGESRAYHLGLPVETLRRAMLATAALTTAVVVALAGPIGFVGLLVPHLVRGLFGTIGPWNILFTAWTGGVFMVSCDVASRWLHPPAGLPVGILTAFLGIPFFVYLLSQRKYRLE